VNFKIQWSLIPSGLKCVISETKSSDVITKSKIPRCRVGVTTCCRSICCQLQSLQRRGRSFLKQKTTGVPAVHLLGNTPQSILPVNFGITVNYPNTLHMSVLTYF